MIGYLVFGGTMLVFLVIFFQMWKNRKNKNADVTHDIWKDLVDDPFEGPFENNP